MAYQSNRFEVHVGSRGTGALIVYDGQGPTSGDNAGDTLAAIKGGGFFNQPEVRAAIIGQRKGDASTGVTAILHGRGAGQMEVVRLLCSDAGVVSVATGNTIKATS